MFLGFRSRGNTVVLLAGIALLVVAFGGWAYQAGFDRLATAVVVGGFSDQEISLFLVQYRNSIVMFLLAVVLLLSAVLGTALSAERARRRNVLELVHWMRHRGCPVDEDHELAVQDESMTELVKMIEAAFPKEARDGGGTLTRKEELEEFKSRFLEIITHQLQTPLTSIRWNIDALISGELGPLNQRQSEVLSVTDKNYEGILSLIGDWIEALDVERGFLRMNIEALEIERYIDLVIEDNRHQADMKGLKVTKKVSRGLPPVRADKAKLLFVLKKLFHNAVTYTREKGQVEIRAKKSGDYVRIEVQDSGVGIPYEEQRWIFKKFFRASNATLIEPNASGVGLFVAKTLVEAFGGQIAFDSAENEGTTFVFTVPIAGPTEGVRRAGELPVKTYVTKSVPRVGRSAKRIVKSAVGRKQAKSAVSTKKSVKRAKPAAKGRTKKKLA